MIKSRYFRSSEKGSVFLEEVEYTKFLQVINEIFKDAFINANFNADYIRDNILDIIIMSIEIEDKNLDVYIDTQIKEFYDRIEKDLKEHTFIFPIENLLIRRKFNVGDVIFLPYTKRYKNLIRRKMWNLIKNNPHYTRKKKFEIISLQISEFEKSVGGRKFSLAEVKIVGCKGPVEQVALRKVRTAISAMKLYSLPNDDSYLRYIGIVGEIIRSSRSSFNFLDDGFHFSSKIMGYLVPFEIDEKRAKMMSHFGFRILRKILGQAQITDFQKHLLTSIFWFGYAMNIQIYYNEIKQHQPNKAGYENIEYFNLNQRFFYLFVSLESLLKVQGEQRYTAKVRERLSKLIVSDVNNRVIVVNKMDEYFRLRGEIVHQGVEYVSLEKLIDMTYLVQSGIFQTLKILEKTNFQGHAHFIQFIEQL